MFLWTQFFRVFLGEPLATVLQSHSSSCISSLNRSLPSAQNAQIISTLLSGSCPRHIQCPVPDDSIVHHWAFFPLKAIQTSFEPSSSQPSPTYPGLLHSLPASHYCIPTLWTQASYIFPYSFKIDTHFSSKLVLAHHHHHHLFLKRQFLHAQLGSDVFPDMRPLHISLNTAHSLCKPSFFISSFTHSYQVFLPLPAPLLPATTTFLQADTQSSSLLRSTCPNHLNLPRLTTSSTLFTSKRLYKSTLRFLSLSDTPHIHLNRINRI